ncbi:hypothetical protein GGR52DRAFT_560206 [Hypoxylon sp. FL1284]|nr:hypothetical protein GGR52DRAFT_560206 [Hypoxylon sp. FL1284]
MSRHLDNTVPVGESDGSKSRTERCQACQSNSPVILGDLQVVICNEARDQSSFLRRLDLVCGRKMTPVFDIDQRRGGSEIREESKPEWDIPLCFRAGHTCTSLDTLCVLERCIRPSQPDCHDRPLPSTPRSIWALLLAVMIIVYFDMISNSMDGADEVLPSHDDFDETQVTHVQDCSLLHRYV